MPVDDVPEPEEDRVARDIAADDAFQAAYDQGTYNDANDARQWVRSALSVLTASIPTEDMCHDQLMAIRDMRIACCERVARVMRLDSEPIPDGRDPEE